jgi:replication factor C large subunit
MMVMEAKSYTPWIIKYRPKKISDYIDQDEAKTILLTWIKSWERGTPTKKSALMYGPPGVGKTSLVEAIAGEFGYEIVETNASDFRRKDDIERRIKPAATKTTLSGKRRIILIDEVDGLSGTADKGGIESLFELVSITRHPIIMTANNPFHPDLRILRDVSVMIELKKMHQRDVVKVLKGICEKEKVLCEDEALKIIHSKNEGDLRSSINDLQSIAESFGRVTVDLANQLVYYRDREINPFDTLRTIFTSKYSWQSKQAISHSQVDPDTLIEWLSENIPLQLSEPEDVYLAFQALSRADIYKGMIKKTQNYDFLAYVIDMIGPGISLSRRKTKFKWIKYEYPKRIKLMGETKKARELLNSASQKIAKKMHCSSSTAKSEFIPALRAMYRTNKSEAEKIMRSLMLEDIEIKIILGSSTGKIESSGEAMDPKQEKESQKGSEEIQRKRKTSKK